MQRRPSSRGTFGRGGHSRAFSGRSRAPCRHCLESRSMICFADPSFCPGRTRMKLVVAVIVFFWLLSGLIGAWILDDLDLDHWKTIARGPITLAEAVKEHPATYPG